MNWENCPAVERDPEIMGGVWRFAGIRLAVASLFDHFDDGGSIDEFLEWFPDVREDQIHEILAFAKESLEHPVAVA